MKILLAVDGSPYSRRMLAYLAAHDEWLGSLHDYSVLHVVPPVMLRAAAALGTAIVKAHYDDSSAKVFKPIRSFFDKSGISAKFVARVGVAGDVIAQTADKGGFALLMMGSHGHSALASLVMGSVATQVLARCRVPLLLVR